MHNSALLCENSKSVIHQTKVYAKRWYILLVFVYYACINAIQMTEYASITDIASKYYNVSHFAVNWTSLLYMILFPIFMVPASYIIEKKGLRIACLCGCIGTATGTIIKVFSVGTDRFWVVLLGQFFTAASLVFIMSLPPKIAAVWFKPTEISIACALGTLGPNVGNALGYLLTVTLVPDTEDLNIVGQNLYILCWTLAIMVIPVTLAVIFYFPEKPLFPPSISQSKQSESGYGSMGAHFFLFKSMNYSRGFFIHLIAYSTSLGVFSTIMILLSEFVNAYFKDAIEEAGQMGFCMMVFGIVGSVVFGVYLDKTHRYKGSCILIHLMATVSVMLLAVALENKCMISAYILCSILGIFINAIIPVGFEFGIELTYPSDESTVAGLLFAASQVMSVVFAVGIAHINSYYGSLQALVSLAALLTFGTLVETFVPNNLERQKVFKIERHRTET